MALVIIQAETQTPEWQYGGSVAYLRIYASQSFYGANGEQVTAGRVGSNAWYQSYECTISGGFVTIPQVTLQSTTDSTVPNATYTAQFFDSNGVARNIKLGQFFVDPAGIQVPVPYSSVLVASGGTSAGNGVYTYRGLSSNLPYYNLEGQADSTTLYVIKNISSLWKIYDSAGSILYASTDNADLPWEVSGWTAVTGSLPVPNVSEDDTTITTTWEAVTLSNQAFTSPGAPFQWNGPFWNVDQTKQYIASVVGDGTTPYASSLVVGKTALDTDPALSTFPQAVAVNSPRISKNLYVDYNNSLATAYTDIGSDQVTLWVTREADAVATNLVFGDNVEFAFADSGVIPVDSGHSLTIGAMAPTLSTRQCFDLASATAHVYFTAGAVPEISVGWYVGSSGVITNAMNDALHSASTYGGYDILVPSIYSSAGGHILPSYTRILGLGQGVSVINATSTSAAMFTQGESTYYNTVEDITLDGQTSTGTHVGILMTGAAPNTSFGVQMLNVHITQFATGWEIRATDVDHGWQVVRVTLDNRCVIDGCGYANKCNSSNTDIIDDASYVGVPAGGYAGLISLSGNRIIRGPHAGSAYTGAQQVIKQTISVAGSTTAGTLTMTVTAAGMTGGSPATVTVPIAAGLNAANATIAICNALGQNSSVTSFFHNAIDTNKAYLIALDAAANDVTMDWSITPSCNITGVFATVTAGSAQSTSPHQARGYQITGAHAPIKFQMAQEGFEWFITTANDDLGSILVFDTCLLQDPIYLTGARTVITTGNQCHDRVIRGSAASQSSLSVLGGDRVQRQESTNQGDLYTLQYRKVHNFSGKLSVGQGYLPWEIDNDNVLIRSELPHVYWASTVTAGQTLPRLSLMSSTESGPTQVLWVGNCDANGTPLAYYGVERDNDGSLALGYLHWINSQGSPYSGYVYDGPSFGPNFIGAAYNATAISGNVNNYNPGSYEYEVLRCNVTGTRTITGMVAPITSNGVAKNGYIGRWVNIGTGTATFSNADGSSTAANQFLCPNSTSFTVPTNGAVDLYYDLTTAKWRVFPVISGVSLPIDATSIANGSVSNTEFQYLDGVSSAIQTQLNTLTSNVALKAPITSASLVTPDIGVATGTSLLSSGLLKSSGTAGIGYSSAASGTASGTWAGGATLNKTTGQITLDSKAFSANTSYTLAVANSTYAAGDSVIVGISSGASDPSFYAVNWAHVSNGNFLICLRSYSNPTETLVFQVTVIKGS